MTRVAVLGSKALGMRVLREVQRQMEPGDTLVAVIHPDDRADARSVLGSFGRAAGVAGVPFRVAADRGQLATALDQFEPDVAVVCGWYTVIPVRARRTRFYGLHAGPLPRYRGGSPVVWQILNGEPRIGLSLFRLTPDVDAGPVVAQGTVRLGVHETVAEALRRLERLAVILVRQEMHAILRGTPREVPQDNQQATTFPPRTPADGLLDWALSAERVHDNVRAQTAPYPGAFVRLPDGRILRIWRTALSSAAASPGQIVRDADGAVRIGCARGSVRILAASIDQAPATSLEEVMRSVEQ